MEKKEFEDVKPKGYIHFTNKYNDVIHLDLGSWLSDLKSSKLPIVMDIVHNLPLNAYNYEYKVHTPLSLLTVMFQPQMLHQAIDIVMSSFTIKSGYPQDKSEKIIHNKRELFKALANNVKVINVVKPKNYCSINEQAEFYMSMLEYKEVVARWMKLKSGEAWSEFMGILNKYTL